MQEQGVSYPHPTEFDRFLYASVGKDRNGSVVTVLSTLARLGFDPWNETAVLVSLGQNAARVRLALLLSKSCDVPALEWNHRNVAQELSLLLPASPLSPAPTRAAFVTTIMLRQSSWVIWAIFLIALLALQVFFIEAPRIRQ